MWHTESYIGSTVFVKVTHYLTKQQEEDWVISFRSDYEVEINTYLTGRNRMTHTE
jgi:hypothetical protein